jgi:hypothetical protein
VTQAQVEPEVLHAKAIRTLLVPAGFPVYLGEDEIPDQPVSWPYLVCWPVGGEPVPADERLRGYAGSITTRHQITIAALASLDAVGAAARCRRLLHRQYPVIAGRVCGDIEQDPGPPQVPVVDPTVRGPNGVRIYVTYAFFTLQSSLSPT